MSTITSRPAVPTAPARLPYTSSIVNRKLTATTTAPSSHEYGCRNPVIRAMRPVRATAASPPLRLCTGGPGVSVRLTHSAPMDMVTPAVSCPSNPSPSPGTSTASVVRTPSENSWLEKK